MSIFENEKICDTELFNLVAELENYFRDVFSIAREKIYFLSSDETSALVQLFMVSLCNSACTAVLTTALEMKNKERKGNKQ